MSLTEALAQWAAIRSSWTRRFRAMRGRADQLADAVRDDLIDANEVRRRAKDAVNNVQEVKRILGRLAKAGFAQPDLEVEVGRLEAGMYIDATPRNAARVEGIAVPIVVGLLAMSATGMAFAYVAYPYTVSLLKEAETRQAELNARIAAQSAGQSLPPSTLPPPQRGSLLQSVAAGGASGLLLGGVALMAVVWWYAAPWKRGT